MTKEVEYDLPVLLDGTVESVVEKIGDMPTNVLEQLLELEKGGKTRTTLMTPVEAELAKRAEEGGKREGLTGTAAGVTDDKLRAVAEGDRTAPNEHLAQADPAAVGARTYTQAELDAALSAQIEPLIAGMEALGYHRDGGPEDTSAVDKALFALAGAHADRDSRMTRDAVDALIAEHEAKWAAGAKTPAQARKAKPAKPLTIDAKADDPALVALTGASSIVLVGSDAVPIAGLPPLEAIPQSFERAGTEVLYTAAIDIPTHVAGAEMAGAFLLDEDGDPVGVARLVAPFAIGGGRETKLPPRTLSFAKPAVAAVQAAA